MIDEQRLDRAWIVQDFLMKIVSLFQIFMEKIGNVKILYMF